MRTSTRANVRVRIALIGDAVVLLHATSIDHAILVVTGWRDRLNHGASDCDDGHGDVFFEGKLLGRVAYNGRWIPR